MTELAIEAIDLAALLCSRVCHDIISPVGAIINGLEVLEEEKDAEMRGFALDLIKRSAEQASFRLQFCRMAFGAAGSAGAMIDACDAETLARGFFTSERLSLDWNAPALLLPKNKVKLILNLCLIAATAIPRGGVIEVTFSGEGEAARITVSAKAQNARLGSHVPPLLGATPAEAPSTPHDVQAYYAGLVAKAAGMVLSVAAENGIVTLEAAPQMAQAAVEAAGS